MCRDLLFEIMFKPTSREARNDLQRAGFFKQMCGTGYDPHLFLGTKLSICVLVELDHNIIESSNDQKNGTYDSHNRITREIRPPPARNNRTHLFAQFCCRDQSRSRASTRSEKAYFQMFCFRLTIEPVRRRNQSLRQKPDVKTKVSSMHIYRFFFGG